MAGTPRGSVACVPTHICCERRHKRQEGLAVGAHCDCHHHCLITRVRDRDEDLGDPEHLRSLGCPTGQDHAWTPSPRDLYVDPPEMSPPRAEALHDRFLAGESSGQTCGRIPEPGGVIPLVFGEAASTERFTVPIEERANASDLNEIYSESHDLHTRTPCSNRARVGPAYSTVTDFARLRG
jgi:hypothetical protein